MRNLSGLFVCKIKKKKNSVRQTPRVGLTACPGALHKFREHCKQSLFVFSGLVSCTLQPHYNAPHYNAVFIITQPCHGSQVDYFAICL